MKGAGVPAATAAAVASRFAIATVCIFYGNGNGNGSQPQRMLIDGQQSADSQNAIQPLLTRNNKHTQALMELPTQCRWRGLRKF